MNAECRWFENADSCSERSLELERRSLDPSANPGRCFLCNKSTGKAYPNPLLSNKQFPDILKLKEPFKSQLGNVIYCKDCAGGMAGEWPVSHKPSAESETFDHCIYCGNAVSPVRLLCSAHTASPVHMSSTYTRPTRPTRPTGRRAPQEATMHGRSP